MALCTGTGVEDGTEAICRVVYAFEFHLIGREGIARRLGYTVADGGKLRILRQRRRRESAGRFAGTNLRNYRQCCCQPRGGTQEESRSSRHAMYYSLSRVHIPGNREQSCDRSVNRSEIQEGRILV